MPPLSSQLLHRVLDTASTLAALDGDALDDGLPVLGQLLGADLVTYHRFDLLARTEESVPSRFALLGSCSRLIVLCVSGSAGARSGAKMATIAITMIMTAPTSAGLFRLNERHARCRCETSFGSSWVLPLPATAVCAVAI